jgi:dTDP-4-amino-4,6-dideoxygalactose transaminase
MSAPPVARPRLPSAARVLPYLREIDGNAWYTNHGPLTRRFQAGLAAHWGVEVGEVALLANATAALTLALLAAGAAPGSRCLMPSWTFAASAGAVHAAGLVPHFVDVQPGTWAPDPDRVRRLASAGGVGAILVVCPFGAPLDLPAWDAVQAATGVPVVVDAAAAFDTLRAGGPMRPGACPLAVSLHATKVFGIGEGGALICRDPALLERVRRLANFGFLGTREAVMPGLNAKLSEYAAAVGLAGLDTWRDTRARWSAATRAYLRGLQGVEKSPGLGEGWVSSTLSVLLPVGAAPLPGINTLRWWGSGCHAQPAYQSCPREDLPVTEDLARRCVGLPFWQDLPEADIAAVCAALPRQAASTSRELVPA